MAESLTPSFQLQNLLQLYSQNLTMVLEPFTGPCEWVDADLGGSIDRI